MVHLVKPPVSALEFPAETAPWASVITTGYGSYRVTERVSSGQVATELLGRTSRIGVFAP
jgi:hypothetical protein